MQRSSGGERLADGGLAGMPEGGQTMQRGSYDLLPAVNTEGQSNLITHGPHPRPPNFIFPVSPGRRGKPAGWSAALAHSDGFVLRRYAPLFCHPLLQSCPVRSTSLLLLRSICSNCAGAESSLISSLTQGLWTLWGFLLN